MPRLEGHRKKVHSEQRAKLENLGQIKVVLNELEKTHNFKINYEFALANSVVFNYCIELILQLISESLKRYGKKRKRKGK
jgi:hypothetical protein